MQKLRSSLLVLLSLALSLGSVSLHACLSACSKGDARACVRLCASSKALLTQNGHLDSIGSTACGFTIGEQSSAVAVPSFELAAPALTAVLVASAADQVPAQRDLQGTIIRGPPGPGSYLLFEHPLAQAPPSFL